MEDLIFTICNAKGVVKISFFRPIYYLGCKSSFISAIQNAIDEVDPSKGRVCDLFAGSGVVGAALSASRPVTAVDIQEYSRVLCAALMSRFEFKSNDAATFLERVSRASVLSRTLSCIQELVDHENDSIGEALAGNEAALVELLEASPLGIIDEKTHTTTSLLNTVKHRTVARLKGGGLWDSPDSTVLRHFGGAYFSYYQAAVLDAILCEAEHSPESLRNTLKAAALSTASNLVNTVGKQFAQPIRPRNKDGTIKSSVTKLVNRDRSLDTLDVFSSWLSRYTKLPRNHHNSLALRQDYAEALSQQGNTFSVVYADPPYTRDHYSRFYHVLETMSLRDNPAVSKVVKGGKLEWSRGFYREERHQSPFCIRSTAPAAFEELFRLAQQHDLPMVLSYSPHEHGDGTHPRVVSTSQILDLAHSYYSRVSVIQVAGVVHNQLNRNDLKLKTRDRAEILITCAC